MVTLVSKWTGHDDPKTEWELIENLHVKMNRLQNEVRFLLMMVGLLVVGLFRNDGWWPW